MKRPRCSEPDIHPENLLFSIPQRPKWNKWDLTYRVEKYTTDLTNKEVDKIFGESFQEWATASGLTFKKTDDVKNTDILMT